MSAGAALVYENRLDMVSSMYPIGYKVRRDSFSMSTVDVHAETWAPCDRIALRGVLVGRSCGPKCSWFQRRTLQMPMAPKYRRSCVHRFRSASKWSRWICRARQQFGSTQHASDTGNDSRIPSTVAYIPIAAPPYTASERTTWASKAMPHSNPELALNAVTPAMAIVRRLEIPTTLWPLFGSQDEAAHRPIGRRLAMLSKSRG